MVKVVARSSPRNRKNLSEISPVGFSDAADSAHRRSAAVRQLPVDPLAFLSALTVRGMTDILRSAVASSHIGRGTML
jgi:hypothetical protein